MTSPLSIVTREPTVEELAVGRGEPSGRGGRWRVFEIDEGHDLVVFYPGKRWNVSTLAQWSALPEFGLQVIAFGGGVWKTADEYVMGGVSKFGLYLDDDEYAVIEKAARAVGRG